MKVRDELLVLVATSEKLARSSCIAGFALGKVLVADLVSGFCV
jgi:hypothetical protein